MAIVMKEIKPAKFQVEKIYNAISKEVQAISKDMLLDFELTAATWKHKVKFQRLVQVGPDQVAILVATDDEIYGYVDKGTKPHVIAPKKPGGHLFFMTTGFRPKSTKGSLISGQGSPAGPPLRVANKVHHPGTEARDFDKKLEKKWKPLMKRRLEAALTAGAKASGHYYGK